ncbi:hypothetical protein Y1Q_0012184 [Alligator mississippiensis]|uniref:SCAN box domain-containing protein n=1 Tax=Alligator mississippiensis TaxID=8496 RepID=A0A151N561_ALLMI|nr:hypothetical protein Y1Q_0012184 [Alligator mississippiensis]
MNMPEPTTWQQAHTLTSHLLQGQQAQLEEMVRLRTQEAEARIQLWSRQQDLYEKLAEQQTFGPREGGMTGLPWMTKEDDVEAYLEAFEQATTVAKWDPGNWAAKLGSLLIGLAQVAYNGLSQLEAQDYSRVKAAILYRLEISPETYRSRFRARKGPELSWPRLLVQALWDLAARWLQPEERTVKELVDQIVLEQILTDLTASTNSLTISPYAGIHCRQKPAMPNNCL